MTTTADVASEIVPGVTFEEYGRRWTARMERMHARHHAARGAVTFTDLDPDNRATIDTVEHAAHAGHIRLIELEDGGAEWRQYFEGYLVGVVTGYAATILDRALAQDRVRPFATGGRDRGRVMVVPAA